GRAELQGQLGQRSSRRAVDHRPAGEGVKSRVVTGAYERVVRLEHRKRWLPVQGDRAAGVGANLRVGNDPFRGPPLAAGREAELRGIEPEQNQRGADVLWVGALRESGVEGL